MILSRELRRELAGCNVHRQKHWATDWIDSPKLKVEVLSEMLFNLVLLNSSKPAKTKVGFAWTANILHILKRTQTSKSQVKDKVTSIIMRSRRPWRYLAFMAFVPAWICVLSNGSAFVTPRLSIVLVTSPIPSHPSTQLVDPWKFEKGLLFGNEDPFIPPNVG